MTLNVKDSKTSVFNSNKVVGKLSEKDIAEGQVGTFKVTLKAPNKEGIFSEKYQMYIKSFGQYVTGSEIEIRVNTTGKADVLGQVINADKEVKVEDISYVKCDKDFQILDTKNNQILTKVSAGEVVNVFFNQSTKEYIVSKSGLIVANLKNKIAINNLNNGTLDFGNKKTDTSKVIAFNSDFDIKIADIPASATVVCASSGCGYDVPIVDPTAIVNNNVVAGNSNYSIQNYILASIPAEYKVRVGIASEIFPARFASTHGFKIVDSLGNIIVDIYQGNEVTIDYNKTTKIYTVSQSGIVIKETSNYIRLQNNDVVSGVMTVVNYQRIPEWNTSINFNMFRGDLEVRYNETYNKTWVINELLVEDYLKGIGEASNSSSYEYLKTMAVAERTYAAYHYLSNKNSKSYFHMFSTESDQVYDGYAREIRQPNVINAVYETRGVVALYNNELIQAFYSANAGGMTKSISQAWGGTDLPYLRAVEDKYTKTDALFGHGIGLSQVGAMRMIYNESSTYDQVLRYYYSGIDLKKIY